MKRASLYSPDHEVLITLLRDLRLEAGLSQEDAAEAIQRPQSYISAIEVGQRGLDVLQVRELSTLYGVAFQRFATLFEKRLDKASYRPPRRKRADAVKKESKKSKPVGRR
jgi:transcriptional regulator with XRE-family HTH domain